MVQVFKQAKYNEGFPLAPDEIAVEGIKVIDFYNYYWQLAYEDLKEVYRNEWIIKQYIIYYLSAPGIHAPATAKIFRDHFDILNVAQMLLHLNDLQIYPFEI